MSSVAPGADISDVPQRARGNPDFHDSCPGTTKQLRAHATGDGDTWPSAHLHQNEATCEFRRRAVPPVETFGRFALGQYWAPEESCPAKIEERVGGRFSRRDVGERLGATSDDQRRAAF